MRVVTITIPGAPHGKGRARFSRKAGVAFTPAKTRNAEAYVRLLAAQEMAGQPPISGPVEMTLRAVLAIPQSWSKKKQAAALTGEVRPTGRPDLDNIEKMVSDGLNTVVFGDDSQIVRKTSEKMYGPAPLTVVTVRQMEAR